MSKQVLRGKSGVLPSPSSLTVNDEIIWTSNTGRTLAGVMVGDVVAEKKNLSITWKMLREEQLVVIKNNLIAGFFPFTFHDDGIDITISSYRSTLSKDHLGTVSGVYFYKTVTVDIIQR